MDTRPCFPFIIIPLYNLLAAFLSLKIILNSLHAEGLCIPPLWIKFWDNRELVLTRPETTYNEKSRIDKCEKPILTESNDVFELQQTVRCNVGWTDPGSGLCCGRLWKFLTYLEETLRKRRWGLRPQILHHVWSLSFAAILLWTWVLGLHPSVSASLGCVT